MDLMTKATKTLIHAVASNKHLVFLHHWLDLIGLIPTSQSPNTIES